MKTLEITTASGTYLVLDLPESIQGITYVNKTEKPVSIEFSWNLIKAFYQLIGHGKDHPELMEELGVENEFKNPFILKRNDRDNVKKDSPGRRVI